MINVITSISAAVIVAAVDYFFFPGNNFSALVAGMLVFLILDSTTQTS